MYINHDDLVSLATGPSQQGEQLLMSMDREVVTFKREVQNNKQRLSMLQRRSREKVEALSQQEHGPTSTENHAEEKVNAKWSNEELLLAVQGVRKFGKDFKRVAEVLGTKSESHLKSFFVNYRRRYNLDAVLKEFEAENGKANEDSTTTV